MEAALRKSGDGGVAKEEKRVDEESCMEEIVLKVGNRRRDQEDDKMEPLSPNQNGKDNQLESTKAEMGEVREENQRLRMCLNRIMKDYQDLQMQFYDIVKQEAKESTSTARTDQEITEEPELVSLSLGRSSSSDLKKDEKPIRKGQEEQQHNEGLALGLHSNFEVSKPGPIDETSLKASSPENSLEVSKEGGESWPPRNALKTMKREDEEVLQQNPAKKARVSVRVRCDTPTMNDGCQWRKYGQKIAKGNPCPRAYYRCTVAASCPVRKQVQRSAEDMSILITTYEGTHNHPLPISATAMASTTSAAASMLLSGSTTSETALNSSTGLNFYLSDHNSKPKQFYLSNSSITSSPSYPTITLDLTSTSSSSSTSHNFNKFSTNFLSQAPRYNTSSTNLNFSSLESNPLPMPWNYGTQPYNKIQVGSSLSFSRPPQENFYHSLMQKGLINPNPTTQQALPQDTIAAATKAITSDPSFQSALAAALTSIIGTSGGGGGGGGGNLGFQIGGEKFGQNPKLGESFPIVSNFPSSTPNGNKCSSSYLNRSDSVPNSQLFPQPPFPFSTSKSKSTSPGDRDHISD